MAYNHFFFEIPSCILNDGVLSSEKIGYPADGTATLQTDPIACSGAAKSYDLGFCVYGPVKMCGFAAYIFFSTVTAILADGLNLESVGSSDAAGAISWQFSYTP